MRIPLGTHGCRGPRIVADLLETAILDELIATYADTDLLLAAQQALDAVTDDRPHGEAEVASIDAQLQETTAAINRYLRAFEAGTMSDLLCAPRIADLSQRRDELTAHRGELARQAELHEPSLPTVKQLEALAEQMRQAIDSAVPSVTKQFLDELIDRVEISPDKHAPPYFWIPDNTKPRPARAGARATPVRMGSQDVEMVPPDTNRAPSVAGQAILVGRANGLAHPPP